VSKKSEQPVAALEQARSELRDGIEGARRVVARTRFLLSGDDNGDGEAGPAEGAA